MALSTYQQARLVLILLMGLAGAPTYAAPVQGSQAVKSSVVNSCVISTLDSVSFGAYQPLSTAPATGTGQVHLTCTKKAAVSAVPTSGGQSMSGAGGTIAYTLYIDSGFTKIWGGASYTYSTYDFASTAAVKGDFIQGTTLNVCKSYANGTSFWFNSLSGGICVFNLNNPKTSSVTSVYGNSSGLISFTSTGSQTTLKTVNGTLPSNSFYIPSALSSQVSGTTYTFPTTKTGTAQALTSTAASSKTPVLLTYYAKAPAQQDVAPGTYVDTVVVAVTF